MNGTYTSNRLTNVIEQQFHTKSYIIPRFTKLDISYLKLIIRGGDIMITLRGFSVMATVVSYDSLWIILIIFNGTVPLVNISVVEGKPAELPCDITPPGEDTLHMVFWFKNEAGFFETPLRGVLISFFNPKLFVPIICIPTKSRNQSRQRVIATGDRKTYKFRLVVNVSTLKWSRHRIWDMVYETAELPPNLCIIYTEDVAFLQAHPKVTFAVIYHLEKYVQRSKLRRRFSSVFA
ncbi:hypothetical protein WN51_08638 [Melipona quadrifasciata]|uniref:Ig-like domain-containing protein n=1 Tax=Melipona quadrifasciata TaxID=166423 RepID=A0A0M9A9Z2_9HYME|nr:hypothetical protein WN51_08638 [Melipona quadrifasciata]